MSLVMLGVDPTSNPTRPPPWSPGPTSSWPPSESRPAPPDTGSCWRGPDGSAAALGGRERPRLGCHLTQWLLARGDRPGRAHTATARSASCRAGVAARPTRWTRPPRPRSRPCRATPSSCSQRTRRSCWRCWRNRAATWSASAPAASTSSMRCCAGSSLVAPTKAARRPGRRAAARGLAADRRGPCPQAGCLGPGRWGPWAGSPVGHDRQPDPGHRRGTGQPAAQDRWRRPGHRWAAAWPHPGGPLGSPPRRTWPATPARLRSRSPAEGALGTACPALVTGSSNTRCTSSPWSRSAPRAAPATTTSGANSPRARRPEKPRVAYTPDRRPRLASHAQRRTGPQPPPTPGGLTDRGAHRDRCQLVGGLAVGRSGGGDPGDLKGSWRGLGQHVPTGSPAAPNRQLGSTGPVHRLSTSGW
jgi:hypothetical protein